MSPNLPNACRAALTGAAVLGALVGLQPRLEAAPSDPFANALAAGDVGPPEGQAATRGSVAETHGSATFNVPIEVPAGRRGMEPHLSLDYSSSAPLRGGLATGWSLSLPTIDRDPNYPSAVRYRITLGAGPQLLVPAPSDGAGERYRADWDDGFARIRHQGLEWIVQTPDGITRTFGGTGAAAGATTDGVTIWHLRREVDAFGNQVDYQYAFVTGARGHEERVISAIEYTANPGAGLEAHARVELGWAAPEYCHNGTIPIGAQVDHRFRRKRMTGAQRLTEIRVRARDSAGGALRLRRLYSLDYDGNALSCTSHAPARLITAVRQRAWSPDGAELVVPPIRMTYGPTRRTLGAPITVTAAGERGIVQNGPLTGFLDLDGDAVADAVRVEPGERCTLHWRKGRAGGGFDDAETVTPLPTAGWGQAATAVPMNGDSCTLNGQMAFRGTRQYGPVCESDVVRVSYHFLDWDGDGRLDLLADPWGSSGAAFGGDFTPWAAHEEDDDDGPTQGGCSFGQVEIQVDGAPWCTCPEGTTMGPTGCEAECADGFTGHDGMCSECGGDCPPPWGGNPGGGGGGGGGGCSAPIPHPGLGWNVYLNRDGQFLATAEPVLHIQSPRSLGAPGGELTTDESPWPALPTLIDIDGDGWLDVISLHQFPGQDDPLLGTGSALYVWRGHSVGFATTPEAWPMPQWAQVLQDTTISGQPPLLHAPITATLQDFDGDGLPDFVVMTWAHELWVLPNMGDRFEGWQQLGLASSIEGARIDLPPDWDGWLSYGARASTIRLIDLDGDGLTEQVAIGHAGRVRDPSTQREIRRFHGDTLASRSYLDASWEPLEGLVTAEAGAWRRVNDYVDLTGDGVAEPAWFDPNGTFTMRTDVPGTPARLLETIDNGRGGITQFFYALASDPTVVTGWRGGPRWVVREVRVDPGEAPDVATRYAYGEAVIAPPTQRYWARPAFLGFARVSISSIGAQGEVLDRTDSAFRYDLGDGQAHLSSAWHHASGPDGLRPVSVVTHSPSVAGITDGAHFSFEGSSVTRVCRRGQDVVTCALDSAQAVTVWNTWTPVRDAQNRVVLWTPSEVREAQGADSQGSRATVTTHEARFDDLVYHVLTTKIERQRLLWLLSANGGQQLKRVVIERVTTAYDAAGLAIETGRYLNKDRVARTLYGYEPTTGLRIWAWRPTMVELNVPSMESIGYDDQQLYAHVQRNEYGHTVIDDRDVATGALLRRRGPNGRPAACKDGEKSGEKGGEAPADDGGGKLGGWFGSVIDLDLASRFGVDHGGDVDTGTIGPGGGGGGGGGTVLPDHGGVDTGTIGPGGGGKDPDGSGGGDEPKPGCGEMILQPEEWTVDGLGRILEHRVAVDPPEGPGAGYALLAIEWTRYDEASVPNRASHTRLRDWTGSAIVETSQQRDGLGRVTRSTAWDGNGGPSAITDYAYDAGGSLFRVDVPDPRGPGQVMYFYQRDGMGRILWIERPDGSRSIVERDGLAVTTTSWDPIDGAGAATTTVHDPWGRLVEVREHDNPRPGDLAITTYQHDMLDRVVMIRDGGGAITTMEHDWASNRTAIVRGARRWEYQHDVEGHVVVKRTPVPAGADPAAYESTTRFDMLGRVIHHEPARRGLADDERARLGIGPIAYVYDAGTNAVGRLGARVFPFGSITYGYDLGGRSAGEQLWLDTTSSGLASFQINQAVERTWAPTGAPESVRWDDGSAWRYTLDGHGSIDAVDWTQPTTGHTHRLADVTRNHAGMPVTVTSDFAPRRERSFDALGRPAYDRIWTPATGATASELTYMFDGQGRLRALAGEVGANQVDATYEYDRRGRIAQAVGPGDYFASLSYTASGNVDTAKVGGALDAPDRDVAYEYGAVDPHAVDRLVDHDGQGFAELAYDDAGNLVRREVGSDLWRLTWDGDDQLREVVGPAGTEVSWLAGAGSRIARFGPDGLTVWFGESEAHFDLSGAADERFLHVAGDELVARLRGAKPELQFADRLQSLSVALSPGGALQAAFVYGAFGELVAAAGSEGHDRRFNGKTVDASGLRHYGFRSYDPTLLRWTSADPLYRNAPDAAYAEPQRANLYTFSLNDPLRYVDPDGLDGCKAHPEDCEDPQAPAWLEAGIRQNKLQHRKGIIWVFDLADDAADTTEGDKVDKGKNDGRGKALGTVLQILEDNFVEPDFEVDDLRRAGYTVVWVKAASYEEFKAAIASESTVGFILDAHGNNGSIYFTNGWARPSGFSSITPGKNLKFGFLVTCETGAAERQLRAAFGKANLHGITKGSANWYDSKPNLAPALERELGITVAVPGSMKHAVRAFRETGEFIGAYARYAWENLP